MGNVTFTIGTPPPTTDKFVVTSSDTESTHRHSPVQQRYKQFHEETRECMNYCVVSSHSAHLNYSFLLEPKIGNRLCRTAVSRDRIWPMRHLSIQIREQVQETLPATSLSFVDSVPPKQEKGKGKEGRLARSRKLCESGYGKGFTRG